MSDQVAFVVAFGDVAKEAGGRYRLMEKTFDGLKPNAQDKLVLSFVPVQDYAVLLALEVEELTP